MLRPLLSFSLSIGLLQDALHRQWQRRRAVKQVKEQVERDKKEKELEKAEKATAKKPMTTTKASELDL